MLLPHKKKKSREKDFVKLKWPTPPAEDPGPKNAEALKDDWSPYIDRAQHDRFFPRRPGSMDCGKEAVEHIIAAIQADTELMIQHLGRCVQVWCQSGQWCTVINV